MLVSIRKPSNACCNPGNRRRGTIPALQCCHPGRAEREPDLCASPHCPEIPDMALQPFRDDLAARLQQKVLVPSPRRRPGSRATGAGVPWRISWIPAFAGMTGALFSPDSFFFNEPQNVDQVRTKIRVFRSQYPASSLVMTYFRISTTCCGVSVTARAAASTSFRACWWSGPCMMITGLPSAEA